MITFDEFIKKYKVGKAYGYKGQYIGQCVSLVKLYIEEVLGGNPQAIGDAKEYWNERNGSYIKSLFTPITNMPSFAPQKGDVFVRNTGKCGHIGIVISATKYYFYTIEQNYNGCGVVKNIKHTSWTNINFLRPKNQNGLKTPSLTSSSSKPSSKGSFPTPVTWRNGLTLEPLYYQNDFDKSTKLMNIGRGAKYNCYSKAGNAWLIVVTWDGGKHATSGFVAYNGGLKSAPGQSKTWKNGSSPEPVYADVEKKKKIGSLAAHETCYCLAKIDDMYLVLYKVGNLQKCGFVKYHGGC